MKKTFFNTHFLLPFILLACSSSEEDPKKITDNSGVAIDIEWASASSQANNFSNIDIDLYLRKDGNVIDKSENLSSFERVIIEDIYENGSYDIEMKLFRLTVGGTYKLFVSGKASNASRKYEGTLSAGEEGSVITVLSISKSDNTYICSR